MVVLAAEPALAKASPSKRVVGLEASPARPPLQPLFPVQPEPADGGPPAGVAVELVRHCSV